MEEEKLKIDQVNSFSDKSVQYQSKSSTSAKSNLNAKTSVLPSETDQKIRTERDKSSVTNKSGTQSSKSNNQEEISASSRKTPLKNNIKSPVQVKKVPISPTKREPKSEKSERKSANSRNFVSRENTNISFSSSQIPKPRSSPRASIRKSESQPSSKKGPTTTSSFDITKNMNVNHKVPRAFQQQLQVFLKGRTQSTSHGLLYLLHITILEDQVVHLL